MVYEKKIREIKKYKQNKMRQKKIYKNASECILCWSSTAKHRD